MDHATKTLSQINLPKADIVDLMNQANLSVEGTAALLDVSPRTIYLWMDKGYMPKRHHIKLQSVVDEHKGAVARRVLSQASIGELVRALESKGYIVNIESKG